MPRPRASSLFLWPVLAAGSVLYGAGLQWDRRRKSKNQVRLPRFVLSIGNVTVGGTGKTPVIMKAASDLRLRGLRPAILTRGYRGLLSRDAQAGVLTGPEKTDNASDETALMAEKLPDIPIGVGGNRAARAQEILASRPVDVFLLDDGFQSWSLARDLDVVCVDATNAWGNRQLLPWGTLREPISALKRAGVVILTRTEQVSVEKVELLRREIRSRAPQAVVLRSRFRYLLRDGAGSFVSASRLDEWRGRPIVAVSGIGNPGSFERALTDLELAPEPLRFPDHHNYDASDVKRILNAAEKTGGLFVTTTKDAVKLRRFPEVQGEAGAMNILEMDFVFDEFDEMLWRQSVIEMVLSAAPLS